MKPRLLRIALLRDTDIVLARRRTRRIAELLGYDLHAQTRITTAVSEIARNAVEHGGGGAIEFYHQDPTAPLRSKSSLPIAARAFRRRARQSSGRAIVPGWALD